MKKRQRISVLLLFIGLIMLMVPVIPHHHHADGLICMKNDITADCCEHHHTPDTGHCCCDTGCLTTHFVQQTPGTDDVSSHSETLWTVTLFIEPLSKLLILPQLDERRQDCVYLESLHGMFIARAAGLRAPPSVLA